MSTPEPVRTLTELPEHTLFRVAAYYGILFAGVAALMQYVPGALALLNAPLPVFSVLSNGLGTAGPLVAAEGSDPGRVLLGTVVALASACLLMLPVTWVYVHTRRTVGFRQSVVQSLVILPLVVSGALLLVQNSTALAFGLGGIVGAVGFRNTPRSTKDTIYVLLAIVIGLAAGVHATLVAATISVSFNIVALIMWRTDFGRAGAVPEGVLAQRRLARPRGPLEPDPDLPPAKTPHLDGVAGSARLPRNGAPDAKDGDETKGRRDRTLRVEVVGSTADGRRAMEPALDANAKRWQFIHTSSTGPGSEILQYRVRLKKTADPAEFLGRVRAAAGPLVQSADLDD